MDTFTVHGIALLLAPGGCPAAFWLHRYEGKSRQASSLLAPQRFVAYRAFSFSSELQLSLFSFFAVPEVHRRRPSQNGRRSIGTEAAEG